MIILQSSVHLAPLHDSRYLETILDLELKTSRNMAVFSCIYNEYEEKASEFNKNQCVLMVDRKKKEEKEIISEKRIYEALHIILCG